MRTPLGIAAAVSLVAGTLGCLLLPALPWWPCLALAFACGLGCWLRGGRLSLVGPALLGFGLAGLHAAGALDGQLSAALEGGEVELSGRVLELPQVETRRTRFLFLVEDTAPNMAPTNALRGKRLRLAWYDEYGSTTPGPRR